MSASLDDHRQWRERLALMSRSVVALGVLVLVLVLAATALSVVFATRGAMSSNRDIVDVLHFVGAEDGFIAREFQHRFLVLGLEGGIYGGLAALVAFLSAGGVIRFLYGSAGEQQLALLFGSFAIGWTGLIGIVFTVCVVAAVTAVTSRWTVRRQLAA
jgi:cell division transport system permease protein